MKDQLIKLVLNGEFDNATSLVKNSKIDEIYELIKDEVYDLNSLTFYGFFMHLLCRDKENHEIHFASSILLGTDLCILEGAYDLATYHVKKALELSVDNKEYKEYLEHLKNVPR